MTDQQVFNPQNRYCIAGKEGCPVCVASPRLTAHRENFAVPKEEILGLPASEAEAVGLCMLTGYATEINLGDACSFTDADFESHTTNSA